MATARSRIVIHIRPDFIFSLVNKHFWLFLKKQTLRGLQKSWVRLRCITEMLVYTKIVACNVRAKYARTRALGERLKFQENFKGKLIHRCIPYFIYNNNL